MINSIVNGGLSQLNYCALFGVDALPNIRTGADAESNKAQKFYATSTHFSIIPVGICEVHLLKYKSVFFIHL